MKQKTSSIFPLLWIMLFDHTCLNMTFPILTLLFFDAQSALFSPDTSQTIRSMWYGLCIAVPHIVNMIATPSLSILSDAFGRKKILLLGTFGALLFALIAALGILWGMLSLLFLGRVIQGAFSRTNPIAQAVVGDLCEPKNKVLHMGYLQTAISIGAFLGPVIGGYFAHPFFFSLFNFSLPYFMAAIFGMLSFLLTLVFFKETLLPSIATTKTFHLTRLKTIFWNKDVLRISFILLLLQISWGFYYQFIPPIIKMELQFNPHQLGLFVGLIAFWLALSTALGIPFLQRFLNATQILFGSIYFVFAGTLLTFLFCFFHLKTGVWLAAIPTAAGDVIAFSCLTALYSNAVSKEDQGKVMGICFIIIALVWAVTGIAGGILMSLHPFLPIVVAPIGVLFAIQLLYKETFYPGVIFKEASHEGT